MPEEPFSIHRDAIYSEGQLRLALGLSSVTLARERRQGRLRFQRKGHRTYYLGQWLIDWMNVGAAECKEVACGR